MFEETDRTFLPKSVHGSARHLKELARNLLALCSDIGGVDVFITLTVNTKWPEITERLFDGQTAFEREDLVCVVFHARLEAFLHHLRNGRYFSGGKAILDAHVIEYQHRGLPHAHIVAKLSNGPSKDNVELCAAWIERHIQTTMPDPADADYYDLIKEHLIHHCATASNGCLRDGVCYRGYTKTATTATTAFDERGFPIYRRPTVEDRLVVPHNRLMALDWRGHMNVEFATNTYTCMYLYKYLYKGRLPYSTFALIVLINIAIVLFRHQKRKA